MIKLLPYGNSKSARVLARELGCKRIRFNKLTYRHRIGTKVINWGSQRNNWSIPESDFINKPRAVALAANKLSCFRALESQHVPTLVHITDKAIAEIHLSEGETIYCRSTLNGHSGAGITVLSDPDEIIPDCPLYTLGLDDWTEWRIHIGLQKDLDNVILIQQKIKEGASRANPGSDPVRNHAAGYKFRQTELSPPEGLEEIAWSALAALGLDFGAIDMAHTADGWKVIEINTACGLDGTTHEKYANYFRDLLS